MNTPGLILASQSPRRKDLLATLGISFEIVASGVEEVVHSDDGPRGLVLENAHRKAADIARSFPDCWVLGSDTVVALGDRTFGKPKSLGEAASMLGALQGQVHEVFTGICLLRNDEKEHWAEVTRVGFRRLSPDQIANYLEQIDPLDKAGAYAIQEGGERIVSCVEGSLSNVVGLPLDSLEPVLERLGIK